MFSPEELVQAVGGDLVLPALEVAALQAAGVLPGGRELDAVLAEIELERLRHAFADLLEADDLGRAEELLPGRPQGDLIGPELGPRAERTGRRGQGQDEEDGDAFHGILPRR